MKKELNVRLECEKILFKTCKKIDKAKNCLFRDPLNIYGRRGKKPKGCKGVYSHHCRIKQLRRALTPDWFSISDPGKKEG